MSDSKSESFRPISCLTASALWGQSILYAIGRHLGSGP